MQDQRMRENFLESEKKIETEKGSQLDESFESDLSVEEEICANLENQPKHWYLGSEVGFE